MPVTPTYPGVYVEEIPSGVRTITGVSTSITAFVGSAKRGPINQAISVKSFADYERTFGGLASESEMSFAVRQFFMNSGSEAYVIRIAKNATAAQLRLKDSSDREVLEIVALNEGRSGNDIQVRLNYDTANPASTFNLILNYQPKDDPAAAETEQFLNLSMNSSDARYVEAVVRNSSRLVKASRVAPQAAINGMGSGTSVSGELTDVSALVDIRHNRLQVSVNGLSAVPVEIAPGDIAGANANNRLASLCSLIQTQVRAPAAGRAALFGFSCARDGNKIRMTSGQAGENSSVRVLPGDRNDASVVLQLGAAGRGVEADAVADIRPQEVPNRGALTSGDFAAADLDALPDATHQDFQISLDGYGPDTVSLGPAGAAGANLAAKLGDVASRLEAAVRQFKQANLAYKNFTCRVSGGVRLVLESGTRGTGSGVVITAAANNSIAAELHLLAGAAASKGADSYLLGGDEQAYGDADVYNLIIADRSQRNGLYALEAVDLFNLLCLPGVTDPGVLSDAEAYCRERRAFFVIDSPRTQSKPSQMQETVRGTGLPKSDYAAVFYPWIEIANPLEGGAPRISAPCGTVAGVFARTDGARGVWKAPAGIDAVLNGVRGLDYTLTDPENGDLNPLGVNCLRIFRVYGPVCWGARTLRGADQMNSEYKYTSVRRLALFIEESLYRGTQWVVFEPNDEPLWSQVRLNVGDFMQDLFRQGAFQGKTPSEAYLVKCDKETTTQYDIDRGIVNILVGFAPLKPAEFVIIRIQQLAGQARS